MGVIEGSRGSPYLTAAAPVNGTNEVQTVTVTGTPTGGTFKLSFQGHPTTAMAHNISGANMQVALRALNTIGSDGVTVTGAGPYTVTFVGRLAKKAVPLLALHNNSLTGGTTPTVTIVETTPGVDATERGQVKGTLLVDNAGILYVNTGTALEPVWTKVGTQT